MDLEMSCCFWCGNSLLVASSPPALWPEAFLSLLSVNWRGSLIFSDIWNSSPISAKCEPRSTISLRGGSSFGKLPLCPVWFSIVWPVLSVPLACVSSVATRQLWQKVWILYWQTQEIELKFETCKVACAKRRTKGREGCESGSLFIPSIHQLIKVFVLRRGMLDSRLFTVNYLPTRGDICHSHHCRSSVTFLPEWCKFPQKTTYSIA